MGIFFLLLLFAPGVVAHDRRSAPTRASRAFQLARRDAFPRALYPTLSHSFPSRIAPPVDRCFPVRRDRIARIDAFNILVVIAHAPRLVVSSSRRLCRDPRPDSFAASLANQTRRARLALVSAPQTRCSRCAFGGGSHLVLLYIYMYRSKT